jgi:hypothetical protein
MTRWRREMGGASASAGGEVEEESKRAPCASSSENVGITSAFHANHRAPNREWRFAEAEP